MTHYSSNSPFSSNLHTGEGHPADISRLIWLLKKHRIVRNLVATRALHTHTLEKNHYNIYSIRAKNLVASSSSSQGFVKRTRPKGLVATRAREGH